jgi:hypothetical protein
MTDMPITAIAPKRKCKHYAVGFIGGQAEICLPEALGLFCESTARMMLPIERKANAEEMTKILKLFWKFCPKCGERLELPTFLLTNERGLFK